jgi:CBS domain-containing protein
VQPEFMEHIDIKPLYRRSNAMSLADILNKASLDEIRNGRERGVVTLSHNQTVAEALVTLADKRLLSAPIVVEPEIEDDGGMDVDGAPTLIGWLDIRDIVTALLNFVESKNAEHQLPTMMLSLMSGT